MTPYNLMILLELHYGCYHECMWGKVATPAHQRAQIATRQLIDEGYVAIVETDLVVTEKGRQVVDKLWEPSAKAAMSQVMQ